MHKKILRDAFEKLLEPHGLRVLAWRAVPYDNSCLGSMAKKTEPEIAQV